MNSASIVYGPFPVRVGQVFAALATLFVGALFSLMALETQYFACDFGSGGTCSIESHVSLNGDARFAASELRGVRMESTWRGKGKGTEYGVVVLTLWNAKHQLLDTDPDEAREIVKNVESAMARHSNVQATLTGPRWMLALGAVFALVGISMGWIALRRMGSIGLALEHDGSLRVWRRVLGVPVSARSLPLYGVTDVVLEWSAEDDFWRSRGEVPRRVGRIVFSTREGALPLTREFWPGETLHFRAAAELRRNLGFSPGALERGLDALENTLVRPTMARTAVGRFALVWVAVCCGSLVGLAVFGIVGLALGLLHTHDGLEPWMLLVGCGGGAITGVALALYIARPRPPR